MEEHPDVSSATSIVVIAGAGDNPRRRERNRVLHDERDLDVVVSIARLVTSLRGEPRAWMHLPELSLVFLRERRVLAEFGVLPGRTWIRTPGGGDLALQCPDELTTWLATAGSRADPAAEV